MDLNAFSHGQIQSKLWLCEELEKHISNPVKIIILGCWYNVLGFMLLVRNSQLYQNICGVDYNNESIALANKISNAWNMNQPSDKIKNLCLDVNDIEFNNYDVIISTSVEDIQDMNWYNSIPKNKLVCLQCNNLTPEQVSTYDNWDILNPITSLDIFKEKCPMNQILFEGEKIFDYGTLKYSRYMLIGYK